MPKNICLIYVETNGVHKTDEIVSKKNMFKFARPICLNYIIGYKQGDEFVEIKSERKIFKPEYLPFPEESVEEHEISFSKAEKKGIHGKDILEEFKNNIKNVQVLIGHDLPFHLKSLQIECIRHCINPDFSNYILIDTMKFNHKLDSPKLKELSSEILNKSYEDKKSKYNITILKKCFLKLYQDYEQKIISQT
tara:strand:- start:6493 stop:7071 length:579 start_codon:yes stop_codon:yes gene_type:complete